jgi:hypothetical protein
MTDALYVACLGNFIFMNNKRCEFIDRVSSICHICPLQLIINRDIQPTCSGKFQSILFLLDPDMIINQA